MTPDTHIETAVLFIDLQEMSFAAPGLEDKRTQILTSTLRLLEYARKQNWNVFFVKEEFSPDLHDAPPYFRSIQDKKIVAGSPAVQFVHELASSIRPEEIIIKKRHSAFDGTGLKDVLIARNVQNLVIAGVNSDACVLATVMNARQDFKVFVLTDCIGSPNAARHMAALEIFDHKVNVRSLDVLLAESAHPEFNRPRFSFKPSGQTRPSN